MLEGDLAALCWRAIDIVGVCGLAVVLPVSGFIADVGFAVDEIGDVYCIG